MDFQLYSLGAALVFHEIFFPESSTAMALILAMGTYGAGYVARIVGAFIFGKMGDRIGRKKVLFITITMMGICTTLIGVLPTYAQIGVFAPILLVTLRIIQGLGAGAEISGAGTMLAEYAPKGKRGIISYVQIDGLETVLAAMCEPQIAIVSLTITEKGYFHSPATGQLMLDHPMVAADVQNPHQPKTATGVIVEALARRKAAGLPAFTVMSCDNMPENGHVMRDVVTSYAQAVDVKLAQWIEDNVTFPSTMVDRIVPAVTEDTLAKIEQLTGVRDPAGVACEPFRQWVIEDNFVAGRPEWEKAGAELVSDVLPYEEMKLRMLNGSHSFLAYLGYLAGYQHINDCMEDEHYRHAAYGLMLQEQAPTLKVQGVDLQDYANRLIARYSNPALRHRTWQIAMDGSQKLPQRMLDSVRWHLAHDSKFDLLALGVAGWMRYVGGVDEQGNPIEISDPLLPVIQKAVQSSAEGKARVQSLLAIKAIFGDDLPDNSLFTAKVTEAYLSLLAHGAKATVAKYSVK